MNKPLSFVAHWVSNLLTNSAFKPIEFEGFGIVCRHCDIALKYGEFATNISQTASDLFGSANGMERKGATASHFLSGANKSEAFAQIELARGGTMSLRHNLQKKRGNAAVSPSATARKAFFA